MMEELVGRPSHLSPPLIGYLAAPQLSIHLSAARFPTRRAVAVVGLLLLCTAQSRVATTAQAHVRARLYTHKMHLLSTGSYPGSTANPRC